MTNDTAISTKEFEALTLTAATEVATRWIDALPDGGGASVRTHLQAGAGLEVLIQLAPTPAMGLRLIDSDGSYVALHVQTFKAARHD